MLTKLFAGSFLVLGLMFAGMSAAEKEPVDCCEANLACCSPKSACCETDAKLGCCEKGLKCCEEAKACCDGAQQCCIEGKDCCKDAKECCGPAKDAAKINVANVDVANVADGSKAVKACCSSKPVK